MDNCNNENILVESATSEYTLLSVPIHLRLFFSELSSNKHSCRIKAHSHQYHSNDDRIRVQLCCKIEIVPNQVFTVLVRKMAENIDDIDGDYAIEILRRMFKNEESREIQLVAELDQKK